jgi:hypothetical protein
LRVGVYTTGFELSVNFLLIHSSNSSFGNKNGGNSQKFLEPNEQAKQALLLTNANKTRHVSMAVELSYSILDKLDFISFGSPAQDILSADVAIEVIPIRITLHILVKPSKHFLACCKYN